MCKQTVAVLHTREVSSRERVCINKLPFLLPDAGSASETAGRILQRSQDVDRIGYATHTYSRADKIRFCIPCCVPCKRKIFDPLTKPFEGLRRAGMHGLLEMHLR